MGAISFRLPHSTPFAAETQTALFGLLYFLPLYRSLVLESDCAQLITRLRPPNPIFGNYHLWLLWILLHHHRLDYIHVYREANMVAHYLAQHAMMFPHTRYYSRHNLPSLVRGAIVLDLSSVNLRVP